MSIFTLNVSIILFSNFLKFTTVYYNYIYALIIQRNYP